MSPALPAEGLLAPLAIIVLAAGHSRRFGAPDKLETPLDGVPLAFHIADTASRLPFGRRFAVCRSRTGLVPEHFLSLGYEVLLNPDPEAGQGVSLATGAGAAWAADVAGALVCLADMPRVGAPLLERMAAVWNNDRARPVAALAAGHLSPPTLFPRAMLPELARLDGDRGARHLLADTVLVPATGDELADFDYPADFGPPAA